MEGIYANGGVLIRPESVLGKKILRDYKKTLRVLCRECIGPQQIEDLLDLDWEDTYI